MRLGYDLCEVVSEDIVGLLKSFKEDAEKAIASKNQHDGCVRWQKHFGDRFSCSTAKDVDEDASQQRFSGTINKNSQYA